MEAVAAPPAAQSMAPEDFAKRDPADAERTYQRRSSWELADDYHNKLWLRQAGGADRSLTQLDPPYAICRDHQALHQCKNCILLLLDIHDCRIQFRSSRDVLFLPTSTACGGVIRRYICRMRHALLMPTSRVCAAGDQQLADRLRAEDQERIRRIVEG